MLEKLYTTKFFLILQSFLFRYLFKDLKLIYMLFIKHLKCLNFKVINVFLPKKIKKFSVVRSPTMSKLSKEQFEFRFYKLYLIFSLFSDLDFLLFNFFFF